MIARLWEETLEEADSYEKTCRGGMDRREVFTPRILYNILALSAEKYCMALFYSRQTMPECHTFQDLSAALKELLGDRLSPELESRIRELDTPMAAECSLALFKPEPLDYLHIGTYLSTLAELKELVLSELPIKVSA